MEDEKEDYMQDQEIFDLKATIDNIEQSMYRWMAIESGLPTKEEQEEKGVTIIVYDDLSGVCESNFDGKQFNEPYYGQTLAGVFDNVTHYMIIRPPK